MTARGGIYNGLHGDGKPVDSAPYTPRYQPDNCPHCEYDRRFPETADGGWIYPGNNHSLVPCGMCNPHGSFRRTR